MRETTQLRGKQARSIQLLFETLTGGQMPEWGSFSEACSVVNLPAGSKLPADEQPMMFFIEHGNARMTLRTDRGRHTVAYTQQGDMIAAVSPTEFMALFELPTLDNLPVARYVHSPFVNLRPEFYAVDDLKMVGCPIQVFAELAKRHNRWSTLLTIMLGFYLAFHMHRELQLLTLTPQEQYLRFLEEIPVATRISQREVARYLNITPVGMNRIVSRLRKQGETPITDEADD